jgi:hypothetical protein
MDYTTIPVTLDNINSHYNGGNNSDQIIQSPYMEIANDNAHAKVSINTDPVSQNKSLEIVQDFDKDNNDDMHPAHNNTDPGLQETTQLTCNNYHLASPN